MIICCNSIGWYTYYLRDFYKSKFTLDNPVSSPLGFSGQSDVGLVARYWFFSVRFDIQELVSLSYECIAMFILLLLVYIRPHVLHLRKVIASTCFRHQALSHIVAKKKCAKVSCFLPLFRHLSSPCIYWSPFSSCHRYGYMITLFHFFLFFFFAYITCSPFPKCL